VADSTKYQETKSSIADYNDNINLDFLLVRSFLDTSGMFEGSDAIVRSLE